MQEIKNILVDMDPTQDHQPALYKAIDMAKVYDATVELFVCVYNSSIVSNCFLDEDRLESAITAYKNSKLRWLKSYATEVTDAGVSVKTDVMWHKPLYEGIIEKATESKADIVFKSTHRHGVLTKIFFTPNDWQLLKACASPLWLAKNKVQRQVKNILIAIDPTQSHGKPEGLDKNLLDTGISLAKAYNADAHVVHCYEPLAFEMFKEIGEGFSGYGESMADHERYIKSIEEHHRKQMDSMVEHFEIPAERKYLLQGYPEICLPELIEMKEIDLIIMGTTYRTGLLGSTAEKILDKVACDIVAVKPETFATPVK